ncbi:hypothetical protein [Actinosynnema sp. NPDC023587]|uniref:hypothetical protein n=1 Tax=Actinosynnema sp. NPDC023587 TaxID=3154695 RepID=UPI0033C81D25
MAVVLSRALAGVLGTAAVAGLTLAAAPAATAGPCLPVATVSLTGGAVVARGYRQCGGVTGGQAVILDDEVRVQRADPGSGAWYTLMIGVGTATHVCMGSATNTYRAITPYRTSVPVTVPCG